MMRKLSLIVVLFVVAALCAAPVLADDVDIVTDFNGVGQAVAKGFDHIDKTPYKGFANVWVTNNSNTAWGDFHFQIFSFDGSDVSGVDFITAAPFAPVSSQTLGSWAVDNTPATGSKLDLYFYGNPINPGHSATFTIYTDNTLNKGNFGLMMWPTPVPEPGSMLALATGMFGIAGLVLRRRK